MRKRSTAAFSLVEVTLALGIAAFCLIAVFGLVPVAVLTNRNATSQTAATNIIAAVVADLRATPASSTISAQFGIAFDNCKRLYFNSEGRVVASDNCGGSITVPPTSRYQANVTWSGSGWSGLKYADVKVWWPAAATAANANGSTEILPR